MPYVLRPAQPADADALSALGVMLNPPRGLTEADFFVYPSSETWLAERSGTVEAAIRLCYSSLSAHALLTDVAGSPKVLQPLAEELLRIAEGRGAKTIEAATPATSGLIAPLAELGMQGYRRALHIAWNLPAPPPGEPPQGVRFAEEIANPDEYARLCVIAYRETWTWLFERWGGDATAHRNFARLIESPRGERFIAARSDGNLVGFTSYGAGEVIQGDWSSFGVLVRPSYRNRGIGSFLLATALSKLGARGRTQASMHTTAWPDENPSAVGLYLRHGGKLVQDTLILRRTHNS